MGAQWSDDMTQFQPELPPMDETEGEIKELEPTKKTGLLSVIASAFAPKSVPIPTRPTVSATPSISLNKGSTAIPKTTTAMIKPQQATVSRVTPRAKRQSKKVKVETRNFKKQETGSVSLSQIRPGRFANESIGCFKIMVVGDFGPLEDRMSNLDLVVSGLWANLRTRQYEIFYPQQIAPVYWVQSEHKKQKGNPYPSRIMPDNFISTASGITLFVCFPPLLTQRQRNTNVKPLTKADLKQAFSVHRGTVVKFHDRSALLKLSNDLENSPSKFFEMTNPNIYVGFAKTILYQLAFCIREEEKKKPNTLHFYSTSPALFLEVSTLFKDLTTLMTRKDVFPERLSFFPGTDQRSFKFFNTPGSASYVIQHADRFPWWISNIKVVILGDTGSQEEANRFLDLLFVLHQRVNATLGRGGVLLHLEAPFVFLSNPKTPAFELLTFYHSHFLIVSSGSGFSPSRFQLLDTMLEASKTRLRPHVVNLVLAERPLSTFPSLDNATVLCSLTLPEGKASPGSSSSAAPSSSSSSLPLSKATLLAVQTQNVLRWSLMLTLAIQPCVSLNDSTLSTQFNVWILLNDKLGEKNALFSRLLDPGTCGGVLLRLAVTHGCTHTSVFVFVCPQNENEGIGVVNQYRLRLERSFKQNRSVEIAISDTAENVLRQQPPPHVFMDMRPSESKTNTKAPRSVIDRLGTETVMLVCRPHPHEKELAINRHHASYKDDISSEPLFTFFETYHWPYENTFHPVPSRIPRGLSTSFQTHLLAGTPIDSSSNSSTKVNVSIQWWAIWCQALLFFSSICRRFAPNITSFNGDRLNYLTLLSSERDVPFTSNNPLFEFISSTAFIAAESLR